MAPPLPPPSTKEHPLTIQLTTIAKETMSQSSRTHIKEYIEMRRGTNLDQELVHRRPSKGPQKEVPMLLE
jgi:hypothetical protein